MILAIARHGNVNGPYVMVTRNAVGGRQFLIVTARRRPLSPDSRPEPACFDEALPFG
jgi:hypothetical protein